MPDFAPFKIFCDLDGVLCDFAKGVQKISGKTPDEFGHNSQMWRALSGVNDFYETLDWTKDGRKLWEAIRHTKPDILTGIHQCRHAPTSKAKWCQRELGVEINHVNMASSMLRHRVVHGQKDPGVTNVITCWSRNKHHESHNRAILIDDRLDLGKAWEAAGGVFVHHTSAESTLKQLREYGVIVDEEAASEVMSNVSR